MTKEQAIKVIENVNGFDDETTASGEAWGELLRHMERADMLLYQARHGGFATDASWKDDVDAHLEAAKEEDGCDQRKHGNIKRQCLICELQADLAQVTKERDEAQAKSLSLAKQTIRDLLNCIRYLEPTLFGDGYDFTTERRAIKTAEQFIAAAKDDGE